MTYLNPTAVGMWLFAAGVGYLVDGGHGAVVGAVIGLGISTFVSIVSTSRK